MPSSELQLAFGFTPDDLASNQRGELSPAQQQRLAQKLRQIKQLMLVFMGGLALAPAGGLIVFAPQQNWPIVGLCVFLLFLLPMMGYWIASGERQKWQRDGLQGVIATIYGIATLPERTTQGRTRPVKFDNTSFSVTEAQARAVRPGAAYTVYYAPRTNLILALEEMPPAAKKHYPA